MHIHMKIGVLQKTIINIHKNRFFVNLLRSVPYLKFDVRFKSFMYHCVQFSKIKLDVGFEPWTAQSFPRTNRAVARIYIYHKCFALYNRVAFNIWTLVQVKIYHAPFFSILEKTLNSIIIFVNRSRAIFCKYTRHFL